MDIIKRDMLFNNFEDFYKKAKHIKDVFELLCPKDKRLYKMYVYSNPIIRDGLLDKIWEYLNEPLGSCYYVSYDMLGEYLR